MKILIVYGTTEGQTRKICEFLRDQAEQVGHEISLANAHESHIHPGSYDAVVIAASVHIGKYQPGVINFVKQHQESLNHKVTAFISVSLTAASEDKDSWEDLRKISHQFIEESGWNPTYTEQVAGALRYSKYHFLKKILMRMIASKSGGSTDTSKDHEYTDWDQVKRLIGKLEKGLQDQQQKLQQ